VLVDPLAPLLLALSTPPETAARIAAEAHDPRMLPELIRICHRESVGPGAGECRALGVHSLDASWGRHVYRRAAAVGWVAPSCQPLEDPAEWSTRGAWGLMAAYHARMLPACSPPWLLDYPLIAADVAARKLKRHCATPPARRLPANERWGACDWRT
jgi:hypothetical protein